ncbi:MAG: hypothetical protein KGS28_10465, partial [Betaproteobacteria bacterium]|nr:hypothetical protein [Betaproteobacteria bacterium]
IGPSSATANLSKGRAIAPMHVSFKNAQQAPWHYASKDLAATLTGESALSVPHEGRLQLRRSSPPRTVSPVRASGLMPERLHGATTRRHHGRHHETAPKQFSTCRPDRREIATHLQTW